MRRARVTLTRARRALIQSPTRPAPGRRQAYRRDGTHRQPQLADLSYSPKTPRVCHSDTVPTSGGAHAIVDKPRATVSPLARRIRLGATIRELRGEMTAADVARRAGLDRTVVSKVEAGERRAGLDTILKILDALPIGEGSTEYRALQRVARDGLERGWWQDPDFERMGDRQAKTADLECGATIREYQTSMLPGLLQTEAYARERGQVALSRGDRFDLDADVAGRLRRQQQFMRPDGRPYTVVLEPQAIWRVPVPPSVMRAQLLHLLDIPKHAANVTVRLLPVDARIGAGWIPRSPFAVYDYAAGDLTLVAVDTVGADLVVTAPKEAAEYVQLFDELHGAALSVEDSADLIQKAADKLTAEA